MDSEGSDLELDDRPRPTRDWPAEKKGQSFDDGTMTFFWRAHTLEHQLPNFSECWWDHWIMDVLLCNSLGIYLGMRTCEYLSIKPYHWRGMWNIPTHKGKLWRFALQFSPHSWTDFDWRPTASLKRWLAMLAFITMFLLAELGTFYLKFILWIPPPHFLCLGRLVFLLFAGGVAMRETFEYLDNPNCKKFGQQSWILTAIVVTEVLIVLKFDWNTVTKPFPPHITLFWILGALVILLWMIWHFYVKRLWNWHVNRAIRDKKRLSNGPVDMYAAQTTTKKTKKQ